MAIKTINDLYIEQKRVWQEENEYYFGLTPLENWGNAEIVANHLKNCTDKFWNNGTNELKELFENGRCKDIDKLVPGSYEMIFDSKNGLICLYGQFKYYTNDSSNSEKQEIIKRAPLAYLPYPNDLCWFLGESEYVLRISATINYSLIQRVGNICKYQKTWTFNTDTNEFNIFINDFDPYEKLTKINRTFLESCFGQEITSENFKDALKSIPEYDFKSLLYFKFDHMGEVFNMIARSNRFANPLMKVPIPINIVKMLTAQKSRDDDRDDGSFNNLVLSSNKLFALENSRTAIYKSTFNSSFNFANSEKLFDAFKTSTNKSAGRSRLILDDVIVKDHMLWKKVGNQLVNMFDLVLKDEFVVNNNLSILSCSRFSSNNDAKRIMMTAKLRAQAIPTDGECDPFTHETPARIVFGDFKGFNFGDSIIISRSFARKLQSTYTKKIKIDKIEDYYFLRDNYNIGDFMLVDDFTRIVGSGMYNNFRSIKIDGLDRDYLNITAKAPFSIGDKITNLHGSKGIVSMILEDEDMPYLKNDISPEFPAGPFDVIVSALSVYRRKSLGQLFEAWALACGYDDVNNIQDAVSNYPEEMKDFSEKSIICWHGEETIKPCGINMMIRLDHNAVSKQSHSYIKTNYARMLKFGEMELLNLASRGLNDIINEIDIRSVSKHYNSFDQIKQMQKTGYIKPELANNLRFFNLLKTIGFDFNLREPISIDDINPEFLKAQSLLTDNEVNLFEGDD